MRDSTVSSWAAEERRKGWMRCLRRRLKHRVRMLRLRESARLEHQAHVSSLPSTQGSVEPDLGLTTP
ncbi:MAG TPA: hypothetical protein VF161_13545 [Steroidobacteraceae bacterium]|jgi:hypothetical protein